LCRERPGDAEEHDGEHDGTGRRPQAADAPGPEQGQVDAPGARVLAQQQRRDEEAAEREEHRDADEPASNPAGETRCGTTVVADDGSDADAAHAVERWLVAVERAGG